MSRYSLLKKAELWGAVACLGIALATNSLAGLMLLFVFTHSLIFLLIAPKERRATLGQIAIVWLFIWLGSLPLMLERSANGVLGWGITPQGLSLAFRVALRAMSAFGAIRLLLILIPFYEFARGLRQMGVSSLLVDLLELSYRYINVLLHSAEQIRLAQQSRLGYMGSWRSRLEQSSLLFSRSFVLAHSNAAQIYDGLRSRGFEAEADKQPIAPSPRPSTSAILRVHDLSFTYGSGMEVLKNISLSFRQGERIALLGENGAGKSTLMRILSGLQSGYKGEFELHGARLKNKSAEHKLRSTVALVFQNSNHQLFCPTVEDELAFGLRNLRYKEEQVVQLVTQTIARYKLEDIRHKAPHELSEGQKKWVCLAAVLISDPSIILLDEPTAALDRYYTRRVLELLEELSREGKTIILSTHDMYLADSWADRACVMHHGELIADTPISKLWEQTEILQRANLEAPLSANSARPIRPPKLSNNASYRLLLAHSTNVKGCIIGAGRGALRKATTLLEAGVHCSIIAPVDPPETMSGWIQLGKLSWINSQWQADTPLPLDIDIVVAATDNEEINRSIIIQACERGLLYCSLSDSTIGNIQFVAQAGEEIRVGVHTDYGLPELAQALRTQLLRQVDALPQEQLLRLSDLRKQWLSTKSSQAGEAYQAQKERIIKDYLNKN